jgi:BirA family transcriptional regulator, biotin operon repressor / biotin---[acetyl-CoA-carboxylase] ligase
MDHTLLAERLADLPYSPIRFFPVTTSTNDEADTWISEGAPHLALVVADEQTAGRGRRARRWYTPAGSALAFSIILRPDTPGQLTQFTAVAALSICQVLAESYGLDAWIKWPNDVLVNGKKTAGILVEASWQGNELQAVIVGVGVNVSERSLPDGSLLSFPAGCLETALGKEVDRLDLLHRILEAIKNRLLQMDDCAFFLEWQERLAWLGDRVTVLSENGLRLHQGILAGLDKDGGLVLQRSDGTTVTFYTGDLRLRTQD